MNAKPVAPSSKDDFERERHYKGPGARAVMSAGPKPSSPGDGSAFWLYTRRSPLAVCLHFVRLAHLRKFARWLTRMADLLEAP